MKIESVMPDWAVEEINRLNGTIATIQENYLVAIDRYSTMEMAERIVRNMKADPTIHICQRRISEIYMRSVPTIIITAESKEDKERLEGLSETLWK